MTTKCPLILTIECDSDEAMKRLPDEGEKITFKVISADRRFRKFMLQMVAKDDR